MLYRLNDVRQKDAGNHDNYHDPDDDFDEGSFFEHVIEERRDKG